MADSTTPAPACTRSAAPDRHGPKGPGRPALFPFGPRRPASTRPRTCGHGGRGINHLAAYREAHDHDASCPGRGHARRGGRQACRAPRAALAGDAGGAARGRAGAHRGDRPRGRGGGAVAGAAAGARAAACREPGGGACSRLRWRAADRGDADGVVRRGGAGAGRRAGGPRRGRRPRGAGQRGPRAARRNARCRWPAKGWRAFRRCATRTPHTSARSWRSPRGSTSWPAASAPRSRRRAVATSPDRSAAR